MCGLSLACLGLRRAVCDRHLVKSGEQRVHQCWELA